MRGIMAIKQVKNAYKVFWTNIYLSHILNEQKKTQKICVIIVVKT